MAQTVVMKFGGTSVGSTERINNVAKRVVAHRKKTGDDVVVVVSAMSGETDKLIELCRKVAGNSHNDREYGQLLSSGEQVTSALTAMAIQREGVKSLSLLAPQIGLKTKEIYGQQLIDSIDAAAIRNYLDQGMIPVVAGFQGVDESGGYTILGRGGSDATAVAVAAVLKANRCIIYTDVDGVYSAAPNICKRARKLQRLTYEEMLELASSGAKVLQARSVHLARKFQVPLEVASSFNDNQGTEIVEEYDGMEDAVVSGINCRTDEAKLTLRNMSDRPGVIARVFEGIGKLGINVDMIVQAQGAAGKTTMSFTVPEEEAQLAYEELVKFVNAEMPEGSVEIDRNIAKLSVVGEGMKAHAGVAAQMFEVLGREGINIDMISTSEIKISVAINQKYSELAVRALHEHFVENRAFGEDRGR